MSEREVDTSGPATALSLAGLDSRELLVAYDDHLRTDAETPGAIAVTRLGPLRLVTFAGGRGFVTYRDVDGTDGKAMPHLVARALDYYRQDPDISRVEWKTRDRYSAPGLHEVLVAEGFQPDEPRSGSSSERPDGSTSAWPYPLQ